MLVRFLLRLAEYCDMPQLYGCTLASNNSGLITRVKDSGTVLYPAPSLSLAQDWGIINEIEITCEQLQIQHPPTIQHIKGHQYREKEYHELDLISQLNVDAHSAAGKFQENFSSVRPIIHRMPNNSTAQPVASPVRRHIQLQIQQAADQVCRFSPSTDGTYEEQV
jgi:hypothetical protein